jgi:hypothetical protein
VGDVPDQRYADSRWVAPGGEADARDSAAATTVEPQRWVIDQPQSRTFVPSKREATAVDTYCAELCPPSEAAAASGEVLETFAGAGMADLLAHTRVVAAQHTTAGRDRPRIRRRRAKACDSTPRLLAGRANHTLSDGEAAELDAHLRSCLPCQALELRSARAERAFAGILAAGVAGGIERDVAASAGGAVADRSAVATSGDAARWIPDAAAVATAAAAGATVPREIPADRRTRGRRIAGAIAACGGVVAATIIAIVLITGSNNRHHLASSQLAAVHSAPVTHKPAHHVAVGHHARARKRTAPTSAPATTSAPPPAVTTTPVVSAPVSTPPSTPVSSQPSTPPPSQHIVSVQQPTLGAVSGSSQAVGSK